MGGLLNKERFIFVLAVLLLAWEAVAFLGGRESLADLPRPGRGSGAVVVTSADSPALPAGGPGFWNPEGRDAFAPRREFTDLPPAVVPAPPPPPAMLLGALPRPMPGAAAASKLRRPGSNEPVTLAGAPAGDEAGR